VDQRDSPVRQLAFQALPYAAWKMVDYSTLLLEAGFLVAMFRRTAFLVVCSLACLFHFGIVILMQITFLSNVIAYAAFVDWDRVVRRVQLSDAMAGLRDWLARRTHLQLLTTTTFFSALILLWGHPLLLIPGVRSGISLLLMAIAMIASVVFITSLAWRRIAHAEP
jgi:hypothetical protein